MSVTFENQLYEITDDCEWFNGWVGISSGEIIINNSLFGHYVAAWYPNLNKPAELLITVVNEQNNPLLSVGGVFNVGNTRFNPVNKSEVPWDSDGVIFGDILSPVEYATYSRAAEALSITDNIIQNDFELNKYILNNINA